jgi:hypothetical protein
MRHKLINKSIAFSLRFYVYMNDITVESHCYCTWYYYFYSDSLLVHEPSRRRQEVKFQYSCNNTLTCIFFLFHLIWFDIFFFPIRIWNDMIWYPILIWRRHAKKSKDKLSKAGWYDNTLCILLVFFFSDFIWFGLIFYFLKFRFQTIWFDFDIRSHLEERVKMILCIFDLYFFMISFNLVWYFFFWFGFRMIWYSILISRSKAKKIWGWAEQSRMVLRYPAYLIFFSRFHFIWFDIFFFLFGFRTIWFDLISDSDLEERVKISKDKMSMMGYSVYLTYIFSWFDLIFSFFSI